MDALSDVLRIVRLSGAVFMDAEFTEPWCIGEPSGVEVCIEHMPHAQHVVIYHLVAEGRCEASVPGGPTVSARAGDLGRRQRLEAVHHHRPRRHVQQHARQDPDRQPSRHEYLPHNSHS